MTPVARRMRGDLVAQRGRAAAGRWRPRARRAARRRAAARARAPARRAAAGRRTARPGSGGPRSPRPTSSSTSATRSAAALAARQAEADVGGHVQVREQRVVLEDHAHAAAVGRDPGAVAGDQAAVDLDAVRSPGARSRRARAGRSSCRSRWGRRARRSRRARPGGRRRRAPRVAPKLLLISLNLSTGVGYLRATLTRRALRYRRRRPRRRPAARPRASVPIWRDLRDFGASRAARRDALPFGFGWSDQIVPEQKSPYT